MLECTEQNSREASLFVYTALSIVPISRLLLQNRCDGASNDVFQWAIVLILMMASVLCDSAGTALVLAVEEAATSRTKWVNLAYPSRTTRRPAVPPFHGPGNLEQS